MAPCNGTTQQWHPAIAPSKGTTSTPPKMVATPPQPQYTTMAPYDDTQQWHHVHCTLQWHPGATSNPPKWFVAFPLLEVKTSIAIAIWGTNTVFKKETENLTNAGGKKTRKSKKWTFSSALVVKTRKLRKLQKNIEKFYQILRFSEVSHRGRA